MKERSVCIYGLGFVGLTLAIVLAERGYKVIGCEKNSKIRKKILNGSSPFHEPGINERLKKIVKKKNIIVVAKLKKSLISNIYIITVGTPLNKDKKCNFKMIKNVCNELRMFIKKNDLIILRSTVMIGTTRDIVFPILKRCNVKFMLSFCPERTIEGNALNELIKLPQIISGIDKKSVQNAKNFFNKITHTTIPVSTLEAAEMIKLTDNMQRDVKFALSNEIAILCDNSGVDVNEVIKLGKKKYPRTNLFNPGLVGGPCLEKDTYILAQRFKKKNAPNIALVSRKLNHSIPEYGVKVIKKLINKNKSLYKTVNLKFGILGLAFKGQPETSDMRGSTVYELIRNIKENFPQSEFVGHDRLVEMSYFKDLEITKINDIKQVFFKSNIIIIHNNNKIYKKLDLIYISKKMKKNSIIYDFWNNYSKKINKKLNNNVNYNSFGNF